MFATRLPSRRRSTPYWGAALMLACLWLVTACHPAAKQADYKDLSQVTIVIGTPNKTGLRRELAASGEAANFPYKVEWAVFDSTPPLTEALRAGKVDIAAGGETGVLFAIAHGARIGILGGLKSRTDNDSEILVRGDSPIRSIADLQGRKIALPYYTAQHYQLARALDKEGIPWDRHLILNLNTVDGLSALVNRQVDALVIWDPNSAVAETQFGARGVGSLRRIVPTASMLYAAQDAIDDPARKKALEDLVRRIIRAQAWVNAHPDEWAQEMARQAQIPLPAAKLTASRGGADFVPANDPEMIRRWQQEIDYFHDQRQFPARFDIRDDIAPGFPAIVADEASRIGKAGAK